MNERKNNGGGRKGFKGMHGKKKEDKLKRMKDRVREDMRRDEKP